MSTFKNYDKIVEILKEMGVDEGVVDTLNEKAAAFPSVNIVFCRDCKYMAPCESLYGDAICRRKSDYLKTCYVDRDADHCEYGSEKIPEAPKKDTIWTHDEATMILELFEGLLDEHDITLTSPEDDDREPDNDARLYGSTYSDLLDGTESELIDAFNVLRKGGQANVGNMTAEITAMLLDAVKRDGATLPECGLDKQVREYLEKLFASYGPQTKIIEDEYSGTI